MKPPAPKEWVAVLVWHPRLARGEERRRLLEQIAATDPRMAEWEEPAVRAVPPCGREVKVRIAELPLVDTQCACGNPRHWLVRWRASYAAD